jgi:hypothetical protein
MTFEEWLAHRGGAEAENEAAVRLAKEAWKASQSEPRVHFFKRANWASLNGLFSPDRLRQIAEEIERGYVPSVH